MNCKYCGHYLEEDENVCPSCGERAFKTFKKEETQQKKDSELTPDNEIKSERTEEIKVEELEREPVTLSSQSSQNVEKKVLIWGNCPIAFAVSCAFAVVVLIMSFIAANTVTTGASEMVIYSVGGESIAEAFYQAYAIFATGIAIFIRACGVFFAGVLVSRNIKR